MSKVVVIFGSKSDEKFAKPCLDLLSELRLTWQLSYCSCHRDGDELDKYVEQLLETHDARVFICAAGMAADLPGIVAAKVRGHGRTVIGVALPSPEFLNGMDAVMNILRMPPGIPLVCSGIGKPGMHNAALVAAEILTSPNDKKRMVLMRRYYEKQKKDKAPSIGVMQVIESDFPSEQV